MFLVDTNVLSELRKPRPSSNVVAWIKGLPAGALYMSVITVGEIAKGIARRRRSPARSAANDADALQAWLEGLLSEFADRIVPVDVAIATRWDARERALASSRIPSSWHRSVATRFSFGIGICSESWCLIR